MSAAAGVRRLALVTGAGGAIGTGVARMLRDRGYTVIAVDRDEASASAAVAAIGGDTVGVASDSAHREQVAALCARIRGEWAAELEVLVANAGVIVPGDVAEAQPQDLDLQIDVMLSAPVQLLAAAAEVMRPRGRGHLLATVSMGGILPMQGSACYSAAKGGLRAFLAALSGELRGTGISVSGIYPSGVDTPMLRHEARHGGSALNFVGRVFAVDDVVQAYATALDRGRLEVYLPWSDSLLSRGLGLRPSLVQRLVPVFERLGRRGHAKFLDSIGPED